MTLWFHVVAQWRGASEFILGIIAPYGRLEAGGVCDWGSGYRAFSSRPTPRTWAQGPSESKGPIRHRIPGNSWGDPVYLGKRGGRPPIPLLQMAVNRRENH